MVEDDRRCAVALRIQLDADAGTEWLGDEEYASACRHSGSIDGSASRSAQWHHHGGIAAIETAGSRHSQGLLANPEICLGTEGDPTVTAISELDNPPRCQFPLPSCTAGGLSAFEVIVTIRSL